MQIKTQMGGYMCLSCLPLQVPDFLAVFWPYWWLYSSRNKEVSTPINLHCTSFIWSFI